MILDGFDDAKHVTYQIKIKLFVILQLTENDEIFFKRSGFESISNLLLNIFRLS